MQDSGKRFSTLRSVDTTTKIKNTIVQENGDIVVRKVSYSNSNCSSQIEVINMLDMRRNRLDDIRSKSNRFVSRILRHP